MTEQGNLDFGSVIPERKVWTVGELTGALRKKLEGEYPDIWVQGEVSNARTSPNGHLYFTLKDKAAQISCFIWKRDLRALKVKPDDGLEVTIRGQVSVYEPRGQYQIVVKYLEPVGVGALQLAFEQLKKKLAAEGLFDEARKRPLPMLPKKVGLVTSPRAAALQDIIRVVRRRYENLHLLIYPVRVQGEGAAAEIAEGINWFSRTKVVDVIIVARGGGSIEDLWAFNEEVVARAIAACEVPVISGVGHQTDFTIADFVADLRAPTPSAAAELVVRSKLELTERLRAMEGRLVQHTRYLLAGTRQRLTELLAEPGWRQAEALVRDHSQRLDDLRQGMVQSFRDALAGRKQRLALAAQRILSVDLRGAIERRRLLLTQQRKELASRANFALLELRKRAESLAAQLNQLSPRAVLERGYAIAFDASGQVLRSADAVAVDDRIRVQFSKGSIIATVAGVKKATKKND